MQITANSLKCTNIKVYVITHEMYWGHLSFRNYLRTQSLWINSCMVCLNAAQGIMSKSHSKSFRWKFVGFAILFIQLQLKNWHKKKSEKNKVKITRQLNMKYAKHTILYTIRFFCAHKMFHCTSKNNEWILYDEIIFSGVTFFFMVSRTIWISTQLFHSVSSTCWLLQ